MPTFFKGHVRAPEKDHLIDLSQRRHRFMLQGLLDEPLPQEFDSVALGYIGPVKDQSQCGSCWDFSGTGIIEACYNKAGVGGGPDVFVLSEEYTLSCGRNGGCGGDDNVTVLQWAKQTGLPLTKDYGSYQGRATRCQFKQSMTLYKIDDWGFCDGNGGQGVATVESIQAAIRKCGAVGSAIAADDALSNAQAGKIFKDSGSRQIDHDIILCGWDNARGAWKLRNSWGGRWADQGYVWIEYGANLVGTEAVWCGINAAAPPIDYFV